MRGIKTASLLAITALTLAGCVSQAPLTLPAQDPTEASQDSGFTPEPEQELGVESADPEPETWLEPEELEEFSQSLTPELEEPEAKTATQLTDIEILWEALMAADGEYAAAASYLAVLDKYGEVEPYATIYEAELRHASALTRQLERLGVIVPENPYLGKIQAPADLTTAAQAWAEGEVLNVALYDELIAQTDNTQILKVLNNLRRASLESHLPAFELAAKSGGTLENFSSGH